MFMGKENFLYAVMLFKLKSFKRSGGEGPTQYESYRKPVQEIPYSCPPRTDAVNVSMAGGGSGGSAIV